MRVFFSVNCPGDYVISENTYAVHELVRTMCLRPAGPKIAKLVLECKSQFTPMLDYPGHYYFDGELPVEKTRHKPLPEVKHLTFTLGEVLKEALN